MKRSTFFKSLVGLVIAPIAIKKLAAEEITPMEHGISSEEEVVEKWQEVTTTTTTTENKFKRHWIYLTFNNPCHHTFPEALLNKFDIILNHDFGICMFNLPIDFPRGFPRGSEMRDIKIEVNEESDSFSKEWIIFMVIGMFPKPYQLDATCFWDKDWHDTFYPKLKHMPLHFTIKDLMKNNY